MNQLIFSEDPDVVDLVRVSTFNSNCLVDIDYFLEFDLGDAQS